MDEKTLRPIWTAARGLLKVLHDLLKTTHPDIAREIDRFNGFMCDKMLGELYNLSKKDGAK